MTWLMVFTSMPRAATSVATSTRRRRLRRPSSTRLRRPWGMPPCSASTAWPMSASRIASASASRCVLVNTSAWSTSRVVRMWSSSAFLWRRSSAQCRRCSMSACVSVCEATSMRRGSRSSSSASRPAGPEKVALNIRVCRCCGSASAMAWMSSMKPMSSMRSASSSTNRPTRPSGSLPAPRWSSRRPGVAMRMSSGPDSARSCAP